jgi:hypothetical protein
VIHRCSSGGIGGCTRGDVPRKPNRLQKNTGDTANDLELWFVNWVPTEIKLKPCLVNCHDTANELKLFVNGRHIPMGRNLMRWSFWRMSFAPKISETNEKNKIV